MIARNLESRVIKLEVKQSRPDELLLVWRRPDADVRIAVSGAKFARGDRVICAEWFGHGPLPAPRWYRERLSSELDAVEYEYITRSLRRLAAGDCSRDPGFSGAPSVSVQRVHELSDNDLLHMTFGVATRAEAPLRDDSRNWKVRSA
jgi:hypothetical protein